MKTMLRMLKVTLGVAVVATLLTQSAGARGARARPRGPGGGVSIGTLKRSTPLLHQPFPTNPSTPAAVSSVASGGKERNRNTWVIKLVLGVLGAAGAVYKLIHNGD
jgi:hypothetical protein